MITLEQLNVLQREWESAQDTGDSEAAHIRFLLASDEYTGTSIGQATIRALYGSQDTTHVAPVETPQNANSGRYSGTLKWYGRYGYIHCDALVDNLRVTRSFIEGAQAIPTYTSIPVTFNVLENEILGYRHASRVVITGNTISEAAYAAKTARPTKTPVQRPRSLDEHKARLAGQTRPVVVSTIPTGEGTHLIPGSDEYRAWMAIEPISAKAASDAYDWMYETHDTSDDLRADTHTGGAAGYDYTGDFS